MTLSPKKVEDALKEIFDDLAEDLETEPVDFSDDTQLIDLGLESISLIYLISELQQHFGLGEGLFQHLRESERLLIDMKVADILNGVVAVGQQSEAPGVRNV